MFLTQAHLCRHIRKQVFQDLPELGCIKFCNIVKETLESDTILDKNDDTIEFNINTLKLLFYKLKHKELSETEIAIYLYLNYLSEGDALVAGAKEISTLTGVDMATVKSSLEKLEELKIIRIEVIQKDENASIINYTLCY